MSVRTALSASPREGRFGALAARVLALAGSGRVDFAVLPISHLVIPVLHPVWMHMAARTLPGRSGRLGRDRGVDKDLVLLRFWPRLVGLVHIGDRAFAEKGARQDHHPDEAR